MAVYLHLKYGRLSSIAYYDVPQIKPDVAAGRGYPRI
jgi:hypothetical protein